MACRALLVAAVMGLFSAEALAADALSIISGPKTGTYYAIAKDIAQVAGKAGLEVEVKASEGSIENIKRINGNEGISLGIVQSDVLGFLGRSKSPESARMAGNLRMVFPFHNEEVHVLARRDIRDFAQLAGKRVAVGEDGSGNMLTAINLFSIVNIQPAETKKIAPAQGVVAVLKGELDAVVFVGGKPVRLFKNLEDLTLPENQKYAAMLEQVHFLPMDDPRMLEEYKPAKITKADYQFVGQDVPTIAVQAVMVSSEPAKGKRRCDKLAKLAQLIRKDMKGLVESGHPKWKEVNLDANTGSWKKDSCVWPEAAKAEKEKPKAKDDADKEGLMNIVDKDAAKEKPAKKSSKPAKKKQ